MIWEDARPLGFIAEILGVLEDHHYFPSHHPYPGQAKGLIHDLTRVYQGLQQPPADAYLNQAQPSQCTCGPATEVTP